MHITVVRSVLTAFVVLAAAAGCSPSGGSSDVESSKPPASVSPSTIQAPPQFLTVEKFAEYLGEYGFPCEGTADKDNGISCSDSYRISIWATPEDAEAQAKTNAGMLKGAGLDACFIVVGNGMIANDDQCDEIAVALQPDGAVKVTD